ncbi:MAG: PHB depolymerase family esterase [Pseudolysinimonas sp.]|uniref:PHB depolymerase family esterase n=1 Tax=Pseudolysinimonas sp. TaxID=2680009 RepID=UPI003265C77D
MATARDFAWREPTASIPLRWGAYRSRLSGGLLMIVAGGVAIAGGSALSPFAQFLLFAGTVAHLAGWAVLPSAGWRRVLAMWPSTLAMWFLLTGPRWIAILALPYLGWLLVRHRVGSSYVTVLFVLAGGVIVARLFSEYPQMLAAVGVEAGIIVASAGAARAVQAAGSQLRRGRKPSLP